MTFLEVKISKNWLTLSQVKILKNKVKTTFSSSNLLNFVFLSFLQDFEVVFVHLFYYLFSMALACYDWESLKILNNAFKRIFGFLNLFNFFFFCKMCQIVRFREACNCESIHPISRWRIKKEEFYIFVQ